MNPKIPDLLSRVLEAAARTLERPSGDPRRLDVIERLHDDVREGFAWGEDGPRRLINDETVALVQQLRRIEREGPLGEPLVLTRAETIARALLPYVQEDAMAALTALHRVSTSEGAR
jgi:hypothetical protein